MSDSASYLYCVLAGGPSTSGRAPRGLPEMSRPRLLQVGSFSAVVASAPLAHYSAARIESSARDLEWIARCALAHERVVAHFARHGATIPAKLFTLFRDDRRATRALHEKRKAIERSLVQVSGCQEWGVRVMAGPARPPRAVRPASPSSSGRAFLEARRRARHAELERVAASTEGIEDLFEGLQQRARGTWRREAEAPAAGLLLEAAYLVPSAEAGAFQARWHDLAQTLESSGHQVSLTGPWPTYHFSGDLQ